MKELWEIDPAKHQPGLVEHSVGWPLVKKNVESLTKLKKKS